MLFLCWRTFVALLCVVCLPGAAVLARDLPHSDPQRQEMLDAARSTGMARHIVKDLFHDGDLGYLCSVEADQAGQIVHRDGAVVVDHWVLLKIGGAWKSMALFTGFAHTANAADCTLPIAGEYRLPLNEAELAELVQENIHFEAMFALDRGHRLAIEPRLLDFLQAHGLLRDFSVEQAKGSLDMAGTPEDLDALNAVMLASCRSRPACAVALRTLRAARSDPAVSALVWNNCRGEDPEAQARCVTKYRALPVCRAGMMFYRDGQDIDTCLRSLAANCRRTYPDRALRAQRCGGE